MGPRSFRAAEKRTSPRADDGGSAGMNQAFADCWLLTTQQPAVFVSSVSGIKITSMPDWIGKLFDVFFNKIAPLPLFVIAGSSAILLFAPDKFLKKLSLIAFRDGNTHYIGPVFLVSSIYLVGYAISWFAGLAGRGFQTNRRKRAMCKRLQSLNWEEKAILWEFLKADTRTMEFRSDYPAVLSLEAAGFIGKAPGQRSLGRFSREDDNVIFHFKYHISEFIYKHLQDHPDLVSPEKEE
jgi:hypothetical protein